MKSKKIHAFALVVLLLFTMTTSAYCNDLSDYCQETSVDQVVPIDLNCQEITTEEWSLSEDNIDNWNMCDDEPVLFHNNGKAMETDMFALGMSAGNDLVAVYCTTVNGVPTESYYFTNDTSGDKSQLFSRIAQEQAVLQSERLKSASSATSSSVVKNYDWQFREGSSGTQVATLTTTLEFNRGSDDTLINDVIGSVWQIKSTTMLKRCDKDKSKVMNYTTKMRVDATGERLLDYGPIGNGTGTISVGLTGVMPSISYTFPANGFKVEDETSMYDNYAQWKFTATQSAGYENITTKPAIRVTNVSGALITRLSHVCQVRFLGTPQTYNTGELYISIDDR
jgi:hypothetical protein